MKTKLPYSRKKMAPNERVCIVMRPRLVFVLSLLIVMPRIALAQQDTTQIDRQRLNTLIVASAVGYTAGLVVLNDIWYKDTERQSFRFFNDNPEWKQADKAGHFFASFQLAQLSSRVLRSCHLTPKKADMYGALGGFLLTVPIEILDGFSDGYGASAGDVVADAAGPAIYMGQMFLWREIRVHPKFSFHRTGYAPLRPELLGEGLLSEAVKDYNGQTYWLSIDTDKFIRFPKWLNIALGYGAQDMIYGRDRENEIRGFNPYRQYYLAVDVDLSGIKTRSKWVKSLLYVVNLVRLPAPALEFSPRGTKFHALYF